MNHRLRRSASLFAFGVLLIAGLGGIATIAQPTSAWFSDVAAVPWSIAVGDATPEPDPPVGPEIPWTGQGGEHAVLQCDGPVRWHFNLTGQVAGIDANLSAMFETDGEVGPVDMEPTGMQPNGALQATLTTPEGDTLVAAVASLNGSPKTKTQLVLSGSSCDAELANEQPEAVRVTPDVEDDPGHHDADRSDGDGDGQAPRTTAAANGTEPHDDDPPSKVDPGEAGPDEDDLDTPDDDDDLGEDNVTSGDEQDTGAEEQDGS